MAGAPLPYTIPELAELAKHCTEREDGRGQGRAAGPEVGGRAAPVRQDRGDDSTPSSPALPPRERGCGSSSLRWKAGWTRGFQGLDVGDHVRVKLVHTDVERGFIDFARD